MSISKIYAVWCLKLPFYQSIYIIHTVPASIVATAIRDLVQLSLLSLITEELMANILEYKIISYTQLQVIMRLQDMTQLSMDCKTHSQLTIKYQSHQGTYIATVFLCCKISSIIIYTIPCQTIFTLFFFPIIIFNLASQLAIMLNILLN